MRGVQVLPLLRVGAAVLGLGYRRGPNHCKKQAIRFDEKMRAMLNRSEGQIHMLPQRLTELFDHQPPREGLSIDLASGQLDGDFRDVNRWLDLTRHGDVVCVEDVESWFGGTKGAAGEPSLFGRRLVNGEVTGQIILQASPGEWLKLLELGLMGGVMLRTDDVDARGGVNRFSGEQGQKARKA